jgi:hypothetical protein
MASRPASTIVPPSPPVEPVSAVASSPGLVAAESPHGWGALASTLPKLSPDSELHPSPAIDKSTPQIPSTEQHAGSENPIMDWDGHEGSDVPARMSRQALAPPARPPSPAPNVAPQPLSGRQQADRGNMPPDGGLQVVLPHIIGVPVAPAPSPLNGTMMLDGASRAPAVASTIAASRESPGGLLELLLHATIATWVAPIAMTRMESRFMIGFRRWFPDPRESARDSG